MAQYSWNTQDQEEYKHVPVEVAELVFETTQSEIELSLEKEDEVDMCTAVRNKYNQLRNEGIALGRNEGRAEEKVDTTFKNILSMMKKLHYSLFDALKILDVDESEYSIYEEKYKALNRSLTNNN